MSLPTVSIDGARQILRPPADGLHHLRADELRAQTLEPGGLALSDGVIAGLESDPLAQLTVDASGCAVIPGFVDSHGHLVFAGHFAAMVLRYGPARTGAALLHTGTAAAPAAQLAGA